MISILGRLPTQDFYVCVSGGIDSMTLVNFLLKSKRKFTALYFDHGTEHGREARFFVSQECGRLGVPLEIGMLHAGDYDPAKSQEENWRDCRYAFVSKYSERGTILMAHHLNDAIETYIMSSLKGFPRTIPYRNEKYNIIRPLLVTPRREIEDWAKRHGVRHTEDPSNSDTRHDRNFVRHQMMPLVRRLNPGIETTVRKIILSEYERGTEA